MRLARSRCSCPIVNKVCEIELQAVDVESTVMGDGKLRDLLHVEQKTKIDGTHKREFDLRIWVDQEGQVLKQEQDILGGLRSVSDHQGGGQVQARPPKGST